MAATTALLIIIALLALTMRVNAEPPASPPTFDIYELTERLDKTLELLNQLLEGQAARDARFEERTEWLLEWLETQQAERRRNEENVIAFRTWTITLIAFICGLNLIQIFATGWKSKNV